MFTTLLSLFSAAVVATVAIAKAVIAIPVVKTAIAVGVSQLVNSFLPMTLVEPVWVEAMLDLYVLS